MSELIKLTGLWEKTDKNGNTIMSGNLGDGRIVILKNTFKEKENQPDFNLFIEKKENRG